MGAIQYCKLQFLVWREKDCQRRGLIFITAAWNSEELTSSVMQINIESPLVRDIKVTHPGKLERGHKCTTWDVKWENYIGSMVGVTRIPFESVTRRDMLAEWTAAKQERLIKI